MARYGLIAAAFALLVGLLWAEGGGDPGTILAFKTPLSLLFVLTALLQPRVMPRYFLYVLTGLILGLVGDVCLAIPGQAFFKAGLAAFLLGHVSYIAAFAYLARRSDWVNPGYVPIIAVSAYIFHWLLPHLGKMVVPVTLYVVVISVMVAAAFAAFRNPEVRRIGAWFILVGAVIFFVSDIFVAYQRFVMQSFTNRLVGLPLYYGAQFLLAFSVGLVKKP
jgi:uncharacterized membrane protein YhhN